MTSQKTAIFWAILAAGLYALNAPVSKLLLEEVPPTMMAALLYLGAGMGLAVVRLVQRMTGKGKKEAPLTKKDMPYTVGMVVLDIAAPIFLMVGLTMTTAKNALICWQSCSSGVFIWYGTKPGSRTKSSKMPCPV